MSESLVNVGVPASEITNILIDHAKRDTVDKAFTTSSGSNTGYRIEKGNTEDITMNLSFEYRGETEMETGDTVLVSLVETSNSSDNLSHDGCTRRVYSRTQLEALRSVCVKEQKEKWRQIYHGLGPDLSSEYDSLANSVNKKHVPTNSRSQRQPSGGKERTDTAKSKHLIEVTDRCDPSHCQYLIEDSPTGLDEECSQDSDSDDEYDGILKPAFHVDGEPDFDSGPPEDGMEYLRRVRWEASQIPKVKVAKLDRGKINQSQSDYMPKIPDIAKCPSHLLPSIEWEEIFLTQFKKLRLVCCTHFSLYISY
uniref:Uncharacterized protein n=1 Tax=Kalanchoe fedtschenkoi TaxID=63787 RepID=A0A7N0V2C4_KALFE